MTRSATLLRWTRWLPWLLMGTLCACASPSEVNPTRALALSRERDAVQAFERGDLVAARRSYLHALAVHDALGDLQARSSVVLSLARIAAQAGRSDEAWALLDQVLADGAMLPVQTRISAHGSAGALALARPDPALAEQHLKRADDMCASACADSGALVVLRARLALLQQQALQAIALADAALALPGLQVTRAATGQPAAERANALRVRGLAELSLGRAAEAVVSANAALEIDQALGLVQRVGADLQLLAQAHERLGNVEQARRHRRLADRAHQAREVLQGQGAAAP